MSDIPRARSLLRQAKMLLDQAQDVRLPHEDQVGALIEEAISLMKRERHKPVRARVMLAPPTEEEVQEIKRIVRRNPFTSVLDLARRFRTNPGRISEALGDKR